MSDLSEIILYLDCDGVILNTMSEAYRMMQEHGLDINNEQVVSQFFINTDWNILIQRAGVIKDAIIKIKKIIASNMFKKVAILTKISGNLYEESIKRAFFDEMLPGVEVITLPYKWNKDEVVDPVKNVLVEDTPKNATRWNNAGGIGIFFVKENPDYEKDEIDDLGDLCRASSIKKILKTGNI